MKKLTYDDFAICVVALISKKEIIPVTFDIDEMQMIIHNYAAYKESKRKLEKALRETVDSILKYRELW